MSDPTRAALQKRIDELTLDRDAWRDAGPQDPEAMGIARCIVALDKLAPSTTSYGSKPKGDVGRVLKYLAGRYGVQWPTVVEHIIDAPLDASHPCLVCGGSGMA